MKAYEYKIEITHSVLQSTHGFKEEIQEMAMPDLKLIINKYGIHYLKLKDIGIRLKNAKNKKEIKINNSWLLKRYVKAAQNKNRLEKEVMDSFNIEKE